MTLAERWRRLGLFERCLLGSLLAHMLPFLLGNRLHLPSFDLAPVEIDLTSPLPGDGRAPKLGAPKRLIENAPAVAPKPAEEAIPKDVVVPPTPPKEWTVPKDAGVQRQAPVVPPPPTEKITPGGAPEGTGTSPIPGGRGQGADYGAPNGTGTGGSPTDVSPPRLLNGDELRRNLRKFYPEAERSAGREGSVLVYVRVGEDGSVAGVDVKVSAGAAFDEAAIKVAKLMKFAPATRHGTAVPVKITAPIVFRLED